LLALSSVVCVSCVCACVCVFVCANSANPRHEADRLRARLRPREVRRRGEEQQGRVRVVQHLVTKRPLASSTVRFGVLLSACRGAARVASRCTQEENRQRPCVLPGKKRCMHPLKTQSRTFLKNASDAVCQSLSSSSSGSASSSSSACCGKLPHAASAARTLPSANPIPVSWLTACGSGAVTPAPEDNAP
jgi:hypothetical protein